MGSEISGYNENKKYDKGKSQSARVDKTNYRRAAYKHESDFHNRH